jgi:flagellar motor switch protein FliN/FliY
MGNPKPAEAGAASEAAPQATVHNLDISQPQSSEDSLEFILDIPVKVSVEVGRTRILVQDLLKLHKGSVLELAKLAGEPLEVLVNDRVVAKGEVIVMNEKFGVRFTDIVNHEQRIRDLGR